MKTSARFLAVLLAVLMVASSAISVFAAPFSDVEDGYDHTMAITTLTQLGVIDGYEDGTYKPNNPVERDEMAKLVYVLYTTFKDAGAGAVKFDDVKAGNWAAGFISWCSAKSIVGGYGDGTFRPDNVVTYDEALKMVCCVLGYTDFDSNLWPVDVRTKALKELKLGTGLEDVKGTDKMTRGQVAQLLYNALTVPMNETKIEYVYQGGFSTDPEGTDPYRVKVPVEVAMTLAEDVWGYVEGTFLVVGTAGYKYGASALGDADSIVLQNASGARDIIDLATIGLDAYKNNTDALFLKQVVVIAKNNEILANATVLGNEFNVTLAQVKTSAGAVDNTKVSINGVTYPVGANGVKFITATGDAQMTVTEANAADIIALLAKPNAARAIDADGNAVVDFLAVGPYALYQVSDVVAATSTTTKKYKVKPIVNNVISGTEYTLEAAAVASDIAIAKGDIIVATRIGQKYYIAEKLVAKEASASKITASAITLSDIGDVTIDANVFGANTTTIAYDAATLFAVTNGKQFTQNYYLYNGKVVYTTAVAGPTTTPAAAYKFAVLLYVNEAGKPVVSGTTMTQEYTAVAIIDGAIQTVKLNTNEAYILLNGSVKTAAQLAADSEFRIGQVSASDPTVKYLNRLVTYTVNTKGEYTFSVNKTPIDANHKVIYPNASDIELSVNTNTGIYGVTGFVDANGKAVRVVLDANSVIYYPYTATGSTFTELRSYNASNILSAFNAADLDQRAYFKKNTDGTYTLLAAVLKAPLTAPGSTAPVVSVDYTNDARLIKYAVAASGAEFINGKAYRTYSFMDLVSLTATTAADTSLEMNDATSIATAGDFYGYNNTTKKWVKLEAAPDSVKTGDITLVDVARGLIYIDGVELNGINYAEGIKFDTSIKVWSSKDANANANTTTYDLAALAKLIADGKTDGTCKIGTYTEGGVTKIAWIIVKVNANYDLTAKLPARI